VLDLFIPKPDVRERHQVVVRAPAGLVMETARGFDIQSIAAVRAIFWLRAKVLGAKASTWRSEGLVTDMLALGWQRLAEEPAKVFVAGASCEPWKADVVFMPFSEPIGVKIAWTIEADPLGPAVTRLATETRVVANDEVARAKFRAYWRKFGIGIVLIRRLLLRAVRREAERQFRK
jgi:hypothetical protein